MPATALNNVDLNNADIARAFDRTFDLFWRRRDAQPPSSS